MKFYYQCWIYVYEIQPPTYNLFALGLEKDVMLANITSNDSTIDDYPDTTFHDYPDTTFHDYPDTTDYDYPNTTDYDYPNTTEWSNTDDVENDTYNEIASEGK